MSFGPVMPKTPTASMRTLFTGPDAARLATAHIAHHAGDDWVLDSPPTTDNGITVRLIRERIESDD